MQDFDTLSIRAGRTALQRLRGGGLVPADIAAVAAAAGGPKGLALVALDQLLFGQWLAGVRGLELVGASVGAWRMACAAQSDPVTASTRFAETYVEQRFSRRPGPDEVSTSIRALAAAVAGGAAWRPRPGVALSVITARATGPLGATGSRAAFARAALANARGRPALARHLRRVVYQNGDSRWGGQSFDAFGFERATLDAGSLEDALTASGSIPLLCHPVRDPAGAPPGHYWDGGLIDYHPVWPWPQAPGIVLFPHFVPWLTRGWLDQHLPWRRRTRSEPWLGNVLLIAPSPAFLRRLPGGRLPQRGDFLAYRDDPAARSRAWRRAMAESERFAGQAMAWLQRPRLELAGEL